MSDKILTMRLLNKKYGVARLRKDEPIPIWATIGEVFSITKTMDELSIVCEQDNIPASIKSEKNWRVLKIEGPLDFSLVGILSAISTVLSDNGISIFAISTYDTDYILIKEEKIDKAIEVLINESYDVI